MSVIIFRSIFLYLFVVAAVRFMGKRQIAQLQPSEFVVALMLSDLATVPMQSMEIPLMYGIISILAVTSIEVIVSAYSVKNGVVRRAFSGKPVIIIKNGKVDMSALSAMRISLDDIYEEMRSHDITHFRDVSYMIVETNGNINFIASESSFSEKDGFEVPIIKNGKADKYACKLMNVASLPRDIKNIYLYAVDSGGNNYCLRKEKR